MDESPRRTRAIDGGIVVALVALAAVLRGLGTLTQPWLDELWSLGLAKHAVSVWQIVTANEFRVDNNHGLNTIFMYLLGEQNGFVPYRLLSLVSGVGMVAITWPVVRPWGRATAWAAMLALGVSFIFVDYGSNARGYGPAALFAVLALWATRNFVHAERYRGAYAGAFAAATVMGFLAHASFLYAFAAAVAYVPFALARSGRRADRVVVESAQVLIGPILFLAWFYVTTIRTLRYAGGPREAVGGVLADAIRYTLGVPVPSALGYAAVAALAAAGGVGAYVLARRGRDEWLFLLTAGLIVPAAVVAVTAVRRPGALYTRYLFVALPFVIYLLAVAWDALRRRGTGGSIAAGLLLAIFLAGNALHLARFRAVGRGSHRQVLELLVANTAGPDITLSAVQKFRMAIFFDYFTPRIDLRGKRFRYVPPQNPNAPEWYLFDISESAPPRVRFRAWPDEYELAAHFPGYGLSGSEWNVYHRLTPTTRPQ